MTKKYGWVIQDRETGKCVNIKRPLFCNSMVKNAYVYSIRSEAREDIIPEHNEAVRKVRLDDKGKAVEIIKGR